ncbi:unnamed protein product [Meganyctiphanes norvegica]|uniref:Xylose isomerase n=1 Tax=Meganyctiphanes norvegica TaxID=48144 RepID=A0AAV2RWC5_MEGNR
MFRYFGTDDHYGERTHIRPWDDGYSWTMKYGGACSGAERYHGKGYPETVRGKGGEFMEGKGFHEMAGKYMDKPGYDCGKPGMGSFDQYYPPGPGPWEGPRCRSWDEGSRNFENYKRRMCAAFEFFNKLGVRYYSASDRDFAPEGENWEETNRMLDESVTMACNLQGQTGMRPLYFAADLFSHPRYMNGAATNPDSHVFAYACAQVKRAMDMAKRLQAEHFVFFHPRDGYQSPLQRQMYRDMQHMGHLYRMAVQYRDKIGYKGHLLIQPKPFDPRRVQYECDTMSTMHMLRHFGMERHYKLYIKPAHSRMMGRPYYHDVYTASAFNMLGMVDASDSHREVAGTSDICNANVHDATYVMKCYMEQQTGSFKSGMQYGYGGFTLSCRLRRESIEPRDMFHGMILNMDTYARALKNAARMISDGYFARNLQQRYISYKSGFGEKLDKGSTTFEECEDYIRKCGECQPQSSRQEHYENMFNYYVYPSYKYSSSYPGRMM